MTARKADGGHGIGVLGAGAFGTALAVALSGAQGTVGRVSDARPQVTLWGRRIAWRDEAEPADPDAWTLVHMRRPPTPRALVLRRAYHYPFWSIEPVAERWRFAVARARFDPIGIDRGRA